MKHKCPICKVETDSTVHADFPFCSERSGTDWERASEKYVVSEPVFKRRDTGEGEGNTIVLPLDNDLDNPNDADH